MGLLGVSLSDTHFFNESILLQSLMAVDMLGYLLILHAAAADEQDWAAVQQLAQAIQHVTGDNVAVTFVD